MNVLITKRAAVFVTVVFACAVIFASVRILPAHAEDSTTPSDTSSVVLITDNSADTTVTTDASSDASAPADTDVVTDTTVTSDTSSSDQTPSPLIVVNAPTLTTDQPDYYPGSVVSVVGHFFSSLNSYLFHLVGTNPDGSQSSEATQNVTADSNGDVNATFTLENVFRPFYNLFATDSSGSQVASVSFTDANNPASTIDQCQNGGFGNPLQSCAPIASSGYGYQGNANANGNNSHWTEGDFIPLRIIATNFSAGAGSLQFSIDVTKSSKHAYDYIGNFSDTETTGSASASHANQNDPISDIISGASPTSPDGSGVVPNSTLSPFPAACGSNTFAGSQIPGAVKVWGATGITVSLISQNVGSADCVTTYQVAWTGTKSGFGGTIVLAYGAHIAKQSDWGTGNSAINIQGSPYHSSLVQYTTGGTTKGIGQQDAKLSANAIVVASTITIHKVTAPNASDLTVFNFTTTGTGYNNFTLTGGTQNQQSIIGTGSYSVTETVPSNWNNTNLTCTASGTGASATSNLANHSVAITIGSAGGATIDCVYTNTFAKASPTIATQLSGSSVTVGTAVHDSSTLTGATANAGGTVTYTVYTNNTCSAGAQSAGTKAVTNHIVLDSDPITFNTVGDYYWQAVYSGDANNNGATSPCTDEHLVVTPKSPTISTTLVPAGPVAIGASVHDSSTISGATSNAGGTVTYHAYAGANTCSGTDLLNSQVTVTGGVVPNSGNVTLNNAGTYSFQAVYSGDANNSAATSQCSTEQLVVNKNSPSITTLLSATTGKVGDTVHDSSTISGATANAGGTVTYTVYTDNACTLGAQTAGTKSVTNGIVLDSNGIQFNNAGDYYWQAVYSGDANNSGATSNCTDEHLVISKVTPTISTTPSAGGVIGVSIDDTATLSGGVNPTGAVTFTLYAPSDASCSAPAVYTDTDTSAPYATTGGFVSNAVGVWHWKAHYAGDANNNAADSLCADEAVTTTKASPTLSTTIHDAAHVAIIAPVALGSTVHDQANISGGYTPTGNVEFTFYPNGSCTPDTGSSAGSVGLVAGVAHPSNNEGPLAAGSYSFKAHYVGDANNNAADAECEPLTVNKAQLSITTTVHDATHSTIANGAHVALGTNAHDNANVTGAVAGFPLPAISFNFQNASIANGSTEGGFDATSHSTGALGAGDYKFNATVASDSNYLGATSADEPFTVDKAQLSVSTTLHDKDHNIVANGSHVALGSAIHDNAVVTGEVDSFPVPATTFTFDSDPIANAVSAEPAFTVTSVASPALGAGNHVFNATVASNANYIGATSSDEPFVVDKTKLSINTTLHDGDHHVVANGGSVALGTQMHDNANVTGTVAGFPLPTISFNFDGGAIANAGAAEATFDATSIATGALTAGNHKFNAVIGDNANYTGATSDDEPFTVNKGQLSITTDIHNNAHQSVTTSQPLGTVVHDTATVGGQIGSIAPTGAVTFTFGASCGAGSIGTDNTLDGGKVRSSNTNALGAGSYNFQASVAGDDNYSGATSDCEPLTVNKAQLAITTTLHNGSHTVVANNGHVALGTQMHDNANVTGAVAGFSIPAISFNFDGGAITNDATEAAFDATSIATTALGAGNHKFNATVTGNDNYLGATSADEPFIVDKGQLSVTTLVHDASHADKTNGQVEPGSVMHDTATVAGAVAGFSIPTPTFTLTSGYTNSCATGASVANNGTEGSAAKSADSSTLSFGTYAYRATVVENENYLGGTGACEPFTVIHPHTTISIVPNTQETAPGENVILTISDTNDGNVPLTSDTVTLTYGSPVVTVILDKNTAGMTGDTNSNGIMDPGETWTWTVTVTISADTTFNVVGDGIDPLGNHVNPTTGFSTEGGNVTVKVVSTTRTLGFWQTHTSFTSYVFSHLGTPWFVGQNVSPALGTHKGTINIAQVFGGFYAPMAKTTTGDKRSQIDQARINLLQQLLAAKLNCASFGCSTTIKNLIIKSDADYAAGTDKNAILADSGALDTYNNSGDNGAIPAGLPATGKATPKTSQGLADLVFWNLP